MPRAYRRRKPDNAKKVLTVKKIVPRKKRVYRKRVTRDMTTGISSTLGSIGSSIGGLVGPVGGIVGGGIGNLIGEGIKYFTGKGDYEIVSNSLLKNQGMPLIHNRDNPGNGVKIRKCEYICDIFSAPTVGGFNNQTFYVNPGLEATFQWLSQVAANFEEYVLEGCYFEYRTMSSDALNSTNTALGQIIMSAEYNAANPSFSSKQEMENYEGGVSCKPSTSMRYFLECARNKNVLSDLYIRTNTAIPTGEDQRLYDLASFQIATNGCQAANVNLGELWVCYEVSLRKTKLYTNLGLYSSFAELQANDFNSANPLGTTGYVVNHNNTMNIVQVSNNQFNFPPSSVNQAYLVTIYWAAGSSATATYPTVNLNSSNSTSVPLYITLREQSPINTATTFSMQVTYLIGISANSLTANMLFGTDGVFPSGAGRVVIITVNQVPNTLISAWDIHN